MTNIDKENLQEALKKALDLIESTISWVEARGWTDEQDFISWEDSINKLSVKDHKINFFDYKNMD